jgi:beta-lactamase superfamily II metal-dependent hydrolase
VRTHEPDLSGQGRQQDLYLLEFNAPGAAPVVRMLIDVGNLEEMQVYGLPYLQRHGVKHLERVYITHPHKDH